MIDTFFHGLKVPAKLFWDSSYEKIIEAQQTLLNLNIENWMAYTIHRWTWWFLLFWSIAPLFIWWKYIDRNRYLEISFFGLLTSLCAGILDSLGIDLVLWSYPNNLVPVLPNFFPIDYIVIPVLFMLIYQKYGNWRSFTIVCALICTVLSLIIDPIIVWLNFYQPLSWQYYYSIPTFLFMVCFCKAITGIVVKRDTACHGQAQDR